MRTVDGSILREAARPLTAPLYLIEFQAVSVTYRWSTRGDVEWMGWDWTPTGVVVESLRTIAGGAQEGTLSLPNTDNSMSALALAGEFTDRPVRIWATDAGALFAANAPRVFDGVAGNADVASARVRIALSSAGQARAAAPRIYFDQVCNHIPPGGKVVVWGSERYELGRRYG